MSSQSYEEAIRLLEATHEFPCPYMIKVIGRTDDGFLSRLVSTVRSVLALEQDPPFRTRQTPNGRHLAVTFEPIVESADQVLVVYEAIRQVDGLVMIL